MGHYWSTDFFRIEDSRGSLVSLESSKSVPFQIKRVYYIFGTQTDASRGHHAHKKLKQLMVCVSGRCRVYLHDGVSESVVLLDRPNKGLFIDGMVWREMRDFSEDSVLMVLADEHYDEADYIRSFEVFQSGIRNP